MLLGIIGGAILGLGICFFAYARLSGHIQFYTVPTSGCEPGIHRGAYILASDWITPKRFDIVCYLHNLGDRREIWLHRVCGLPGDTIAMHGGRLFVNGMDADSTLRLKHRYAVTQSIKAKLIEQGHIGPDDWHWLAGDSIAVFVEDEAASRMRLKRAVIEVPQSFFHRPEWTENDLPATEVPAGCWFLLGDNRHSSRDSRYIGFVPVSKYLGTVFKVIN